MRIACLFIPHFPVAVERAHRPELRSQPVVIGGTPEERKLVADCSTEALQHGVQVGMPLREALSRCREAAFLDARHTLYDETAAAINRALGAISPLVEAADLGQVFVGLAGLERLAETLSPIPTVGAAVSGRPRGGAGEVTNVVTNVAAGFSLRRSRSIKRPHNFGENPELTSPPQTTYAHPKGCGYTSPHSVSTSPYLRAERTPNAETLLARAMAQATKQASQLTPRVGIADGKFAAFAAAITSSPDKPHIIAPGAAPGFLAGLPVTYLPGDGEMLRRLRLFGLQTLGQLAALPLGAVQAQFGPAGRHAWKLANGIDDAPLIPQDHPIAFAERLSFPAPIGNVDALYIAAQHLIMRIMSRPEFARRAARGLRFKALLTNSNIWERQLVFREPLATYNRIFLALRSKLEGITLPATVEEIEVEFLDLCGEGGIQGNLFTSLRGHQLNRLDEVVRQLKSRYGRTPIAKVVEVEPWSRIPERRMALIDYDP